jgi:hypothetical protein
MKRALLVAVAALHLLVPTVPVCCLGGAAFVIFIPGQAQAQEDPNKLIGDGILLRKQGQNEEAARLFQRAYLMTKSVRALAHLGTAEYDLQRWLDAEIHLAEALRTRNDPWIEERRAMIKQTLDWARGKLGWLQVVGRPAGAEVEVGGRTIGRLPLAEPLRMEAGEVHVRVSAEGYETFRRSVVVQKEQTATVAVDLEKAEGGPVTNRRPRETETFGPPPPIEVRNSVTGGTNWRWPAAWVSAGFATLLTGTGIAFLVVHNNKVSEFGDLKDKTTGKLICSTALGESAGGPKCASLLAEANQAQAIMTGSFIGAGAAAILATVFFATAPPSSRSDQLAAAPRFACAPDLAPGQTGATCRLRF